MKPTVLIFLKAPIPGQAKTRLAAGVGDEEAIRIYSKLVHRQLAAIPADWPVEVHFAPPDGEPMVRAWIGEKSARTFHPQIPAELGRRLEHAGEGAFARGASAVFFIGGDCVELGREVLTAALTVLETKPAVLGPALDGGYYLLGLTRMRTELFRDIRWGTTFVAEETRARLRQSGCAWSELPPLRDVDTAADWEALRHRL